MNKIDFCLDLNERQCEAVQTPSQYVRVVAGAGSGKTRVLTYRIAYLIKEMDVVPWKILAFTFTNKVAKEMQDRVINIVPEASKHLTIKTFHSFAAMFLRKEISYLGYPSNFTILDEEDQLKLVKDLGVELGYKKSDAVIKKAIAYISKQKLVGRYPEDIPISKETFADEKVCLELYEMYEESKKKMYALDFDDLLLRTNEILSTYIEVREKWQNRIDHILIDEFQDTNDIEYKMISLLKKPSACLYVVGDPDQTIYTWRGANQKIILDLENIYPTMETIILDRNYRSSQNILDAANKLIANNRMRVPKNLYTKNNRGKDIVIKSCPTSRNEADYVARTIKKLNEVDKVALTDIVLLYRSSYITQEFEQAFAQYNIPYRIYGGQKFYQRREIKDLLAYFRVISNIKDDISFERIINVPKRNIGESSVNKYKAEAQEANLSLYEYISSIKPEDSEAPKKATINLQNLIIRIEKTRKDIENESEIFSKILEDFIYDIGYREYLLKEDDGDDRIDNVNALFEDIKHFIKNNPESKFEEYLNNVALISAQDEVQTGEFVTLMTVHTAKGLEFQIVFIVRLNESVFPHQRSLMEAGYKGLEEERRLCYVAMTRAMKELYISFTNDFSYVAGGTLTPSQFIKQAGLVVKSQPTQSGGYGYSDRRPKTIFFDDGPSMGYESQAPVRQNLAPKTNDVDHWMVGDICKHIRFGRGVVIKVDGGGIITVRFDTEGVKSLMGNHPSLTKGGNEA